MGRLTAPRWVDETDWGFGWIAPERPQLQLASHALLADGGVWVVDANDGDGVEERIRALGEPAGVVQLLDRHRRDCADLARRFGVRHHVVSLEGVAPFEAVPVVQRRWWRESALWWPERRVLVCADALGTVPHYFALGGEPLGVHPLLRLKPPRGLAELEPEHVLCGHGAGVHERAAEAVHDALAHALRRAPRMLFELPASFVRH